MGCADHCHEALTSRPTIWGSGPVRASVLAWVLVTAGLISSWLRAPSLIPTLFYASAVLSGGFYFAREAVQELWMEKAVGIELLMSVAIAGAAFLGQWREAALVAALYSITEALEGFTIQRTRYAIRNLMDLVPPKARVLRDGKELEVGVKEVQVGDRIQVRPGESIPVDGVVREGFSSVNESAITGESLPVEHGSGDDVFAGTLNGEGALQIEATKPYAESTVSKIIELVEKAQAQKGKSQLFVERFGRIYSPSVLVASVLIGGVPFLLGWDAGAWARKAVSFLVAASPCAMAVATPVTLVAAIGSAARRGVLIKGGVIVETLGKVRALAFDKTGTLTHGEPELTGVYVVGGDEQSLLSKVAAVEHYSEHPIGRSIVRAAVQRKLDLPVASDFRSITAAGVEAMVEGHKVAVLKPSAARERGLSFPPDAAAWIKKAEEAGNSVVVAIDEGRFVGLLSVADTVRPEAKALVESLKKAGIAHIVMLTGDNEGTARAIAAQVGIDEFSGGLLPEDKVKQIAEISRKYGEVAMVGDGINDAPALAEASIGIAMGVRGSDAALAAADVALMADDLSKLHYAIVLGRRSRRVILQNLGLSIVIVAALVVGTFAANWSMLTAVLSHEGSEVLIILNGLRVALTRPGASGPG